VIGEAALHELAGAQPHRLAKAGARRRSYRRALAGGLPARAARRAREEIRRAGRRAGLAVTARPDGQQSIVERHGNAEQRLCRCVGGRQPVGLDPARAAPGEDVRRARVGEPGDGRPARPHHHLRAARLHRSATADGNRRAELGATRRAGGRQLRLLAPP
jgi:hypothetical protein